MKLGFYFSNSCRTIKWEIILHRSRLMPILFLGLPTSFLKRVTLFLMGLYIVFVVVLHFSLLLGLVSIRIWISIQVVFCIQFCLIRISLLGLSMVCFSKRLKSILNKFVFLIMLYLSLTTAKILFFPQKTSFYHYHVIELEKF